MKSAAVILRCVWLFVSASPCFCMASIGAAQEPRLSKPGESIAIELSSTDPQIVANALRRLPLEIRAIESSLISIASQKGDSVEKYGAVMAMASTRSERCLIFLAQNIGYKSGHARREVSPLQRYPAAGVLQEAGEASITPLCEVLTTRAFSETELNVCAFTLALIYADLRDVGAIRIERELRAWESRKSNDVAISNLRLLHRFYLRADLDDV